MMAPKPRIAFIYIVGFPLEIADSGVDTSTLAGLHLSSLDPQQNLSM